MDRYDSSCVVWDMVHIYDDHIGITWNKPISIFYQGICFYNDSHLRGFGMEKNGILVIRTTLNKMVIIRIGPVLLHW